MSCEYKKYIDSLLDGKLNEKKLKELEEHAKGCKECADKLQEIRMADETIKNELNKYPFVSSKDKIMKSIENKKSSPVLPLLYRSRKYICGIAAVIILVFSIQFIKPYFNNMKSTAENNNTKPVNTNKLPSNVNTDNQAKNPETIDVHNLKFTLPANWSVEINQYNAAVFYENGVKNDGALVINKNYYYKGEELIHNITPNHSELLWNEDINVPLGSGKMAAFKITSPAAAPIQTEEFEIAAIIPISDQQAYEIWIKTKDASNASKNLFMSILNGISYNTQAKKHNKFGNIDKDDITSFTISNYKAIFKEINNKADRDKIIDLLNSIKILQSDVGVPDGMGYAVEITYSNGENLIAAFVTSTGGNNMLYTSDGKSISSYVDKSIENDLKNYYDKN